MQYSDYVTALGALLAMSQSITAPATAAPAPTVPDFNNILPRCIEFAELMLYRDPDMDFLATRTTDATTACTANTREISLPAQIVIPISLNVISPAGATPDAGTRNNVEIVQKAFIDMFFQTVAPTTTPSIPVYAALVAENNSTLVKSAVLGPAPDAAYTCEWFGTFRPAPLSPTNTQTFLSLYLPDLFLSASMIFMSGYQRNFGAQSDDPKMALSWRAVYDEQKKGPTVEEARKKSQGPGWTAFAPTPVATPPRA